MRLSNAAVATLLAFGLAGCSGSPEAEQAPVHLALLLDAAETRGAAFPADVPAAVEWRRDELWRHWRVARPRNPAVAPARATPSAEGLRLTLTDATRSPADGRPVGGIHVDLPDWSGHDWGTVEVRARSSGAVTGLAAGVNLREGEGTRADFPAPFRSWLGRADVVSDGSARSYRLPGDGLPGGLPAESRWWQLGLWFTASEPAEIEILSIRVLPREAAFAGDPVATWAEGPGRRPAVSIRAPGRADYVVTIPPEARLDVALGVVRADAPVTFRITARREPGRAHTLLEETLGSPAKWVRRSVELGHLAGRAVSLALEADAERAGTVALWRDPTLYTPGRLSVTVLDDATGRETPVRVRLTDEDGASAPLPEAAIEVMYGWDDRAVGFGFQPDSAFYVDRGFEVMLQPGRYRLALSKGYEYLAQGHELEVPPGGTLARTFRLERWIDMPERGWFSGDDHIHLRRSPRVNPLILKWIAAEDIHVGALLQMGDFWTTYFAQYAWGRDGVYQIEDRFLTSGQEEPRTHELGHTISLAADEFVRFQGEYYHYDRVFDRVRELGGLTGYAHQGVLFHGYRGLTLDVLRGKVDFLEILQFCARDGPLHVDHYYHFLDLGFKLTATAGSDFPWCGVGPGWNSRIGDARFYTYVGEDFTFDTWRESLRAGRTFVSSGPVVELEVNGRMPGDELEVAAGTPVTVRARARGHREQVPLASLEVVGHGRALARVSADEPSQTPDRLSVELELSLEHGMWIAARVDAGPGQTAHTTPVYVTVNGSGFHNPETAGRYLDLSERYLDDLEREIAEPSQAVHLHAWRHREGLEARIAETREAIERLRASVAGGR